MDPNILTALASLGLSGQVIAYFGAIVTITTALVKILPTPATGDAGVYPRVWNAVSWIAHFGKPVVQPEPKP